MAGLFDNLADFFEGLFSSDPQALKVKRALRDQAETLSGVRPAVFAVKSEQLLPGFAQSWGQVNALLQPLRDLFDKTLSNPDRKIQDLSLGYMIESTLSGDLTDRRQALTYEAVRDRLSRSSDPKREAQLLAAEASALFADYKKQDAESIQQSFEALYRLKALTGQNLVPMLTQFGHDAAKGSQHYHAVDGDNVLTDLLDLYYVVEGLDVGPGVEVLLGLLLERVGPNKAAENRRKTGQLLNRLRDLTRGPCSARVTLSLIRLLKRDPEALPEVQKFPERVVLSYATGLAERFTRDRDRATREQSESSLEADIAALFPGTPLLPLTIYNDDTSEQFANAGLPGLSAVKPLQILRSFCFAVLKTGYLDAVKKVVLTGAFSEKEWGEKLGDWLYASDEVLAHIEAFDHGLEEDSKIGLPVFEKYLSGKVPVSPVTRQLVDKLNRAASTVLEDEARVLSQLAARVQEILTDYKNPQPTFVLNIKGLGGKDQRTMLEGLVNGYNKTVQLLKILKHFIVVK
jgi:hypothetical protein